MARNRWLQNSLARRDREQEILAVGLGGLELTGLRVLEGLRKHSKSLS